MVEKKQDNPNNVLGSMCFIAELYNHFHPCFSLQCRSCIKHRTKPGILCIQFPSTGPRILAHSEWHWWTTRFIAFSPDNPRRWVLSSWLILQSNSTHSPGNDLLPQLALGTDIYWKPSMFHFKCRNESFKDQASSLQSQIKCENVCLVMWSDFQLGT